MAYMDRMTNERKARFVLVDIYFNSASFDKITRDANTNFINQLSLIGGTLGLFTGFSLMSAFEILYYITKMIINVLLYRHQMKQKEKEEKNQEPQNNDAQGELFKSAFLYGIGQEEDQFASLFSVPNDGKEEMIKSDLMLGTSQHGENFKSLFSVKNDG